ncbi:MAG: adenine deaminase [Deltaproteobacteria bacterium]|nr:adenine deaminase [Deltaproteobacteria bacterium]
MNRDELVKVARGDMPADLVIRNGKLVNVNSGEIYAAGVAIKDDRIAAIGDVEYTVGADTEIVDAGGQYLCPGFIDGHIHVGGSQFSMTEFARAVIAKGTTAISTDFYEIGVVAGTKAIRFALDEMNRTPLKTFFTIPPHHYLGHGPLGNTNTIDENDMLQMLEWPECTGPAEWNVFLWDLPIEGIRNVTEASWKKKKIIGGHFGQIPAELANATIALGIYSEHETAEADEAVERIRAGVHIQVREGSAGRDLEKVVKAITELKADPRHFSFCTDEQEAEAIVLDGHLDKKIRMAIDHGVDPVAAIQMASLNAAEYFRVSDDLGSIAPGKIADVVIVDDLKAFNVTKVIADGKVVARDGKYVGELDAPDYPDYFFNTIKIQRPTTPEDFIVPAPDNASGKVKARVIGVNEGSLVTEDRQLQLPVEGGNVLADQSQDVIKIAVLDRYEASGRIGKAFVQGFGIKAGAIGSSFNPGQMNLMVAGTNDRDMSVAANRIAELGGGYVVALDGKIIGELPMPLLGLFANEPVEQVVDKLNVINSAIKEKLGTDFPGLHTAIAFVCLAVSIPTLKICDQGLADIRTMELVDIVV